MECTPSEPQAFCAAVLVNDVRVAEPRVVPLTPVQTASDCAITCSISVNRPPAIWFCVKIVTGFVFSAVLQRTAMLPDEINWCVRTGQAEPPEIDAGWRISGTIMPNE